jgi:transcriptional regulator with XRE-family HTH domain
MNKILVAARLAKGISQKYIADKLKIQESVYKELELEITDITYDMAEKLESLYNIPAEYFIGCDFKNSIKTSINALEKQKEIIAGSDIQNISIPAQTHIALAKMGVDALIAKQKQILLLRHNEELERMNAVLRELYKNARSK